jgi:hypothetical protein
MVIAALGELREAIRYHAAVVRATTRVLIVEQLLLLGDQEARRRSPCRELLRFFERDVHTIAGEVLQARAGAGDVSHPPACVLARIAERCADEAVRPDGALHAGLYCRRSSREVSNGVVGTASQHTWVDFWLGILENLPDGPTLFISRNPCERAPPPPPSIPHHPTADGLVLTVSYR